MRIAVCVDRHEAIRALCVLSPAAVAPLSRGQRLQAAANLAQLQRDGRVAVALLQAQPVLARAKERARSLCPGAERTRRTRRGTALLRRRRTWAISTARAS